MKKVYLTLLLLAFVAIMQAQHIAVKEFYYAENDLTARTHGTSEEDQNGNLCAIIKVRTTEKGIWAFDVGMLGVTKTEFQNTAHPAEIWVYVPFGVTRMTIQHEHLGLLDKWPFPYSIDRGCTYIMEITTSDTMRHTVGVNQQYLTFQVSPANAMLEVDGRLWEVNSDGSATRFVDFGTYNYVVKAPNYHTEVGKVTVDDLESTIKVCISLKPDFVQVTLQVDADAEIWVDNEKKGVRSWTGVLGKGTYKVECKQAGHETAYSMQKITDDMAGQTIILPTPNPIYGSLSIESTPSYATIYLDGKPMGETPRFIREILVGVHEVKVTKEGYADYVGTVSIARDEHQQIRAKLETDATATVTAVNRQEEHPVVADSPTITLEKRTAQKGFRKKGFVMRPEVGCAYYHILSPSAHLSMGYQFGPHFYLGGNSGFDCHYDNYYYEDRYTLFGLDSRWYILDRKWSPIVDVEIGLGIYGREYDYELKLKVGCAIKNWEMTLGFGSGGFILDLSYRFGFSSLKSKKQ